ncbi:MAG TPA: class I SAM-dependent methyltransferase [Tepidisphaeraceae bacterium]|nr:class I SAM-dependent methyltransferase [Tepidisphaeraceae bacterium]
MTRLDDAHRREQLQDLYRNSKGAVRSTFASDPGQAAAYYCQLMDFVSRLVTPGPEKKLLDVGCGSGWSSFEFAKRGFDVTGIDLNPDAFEAPADPAYALRLRARSAMDIPFPDNSFDLVVTYQCLEHVPAPERALDEMTRVCSPGGLVVVVGPNLLSPVKGLATLCNPRAWSRLQFRRKPETPMHPYGNTVPEILSVSVRDMVHLVRKLLRRRPEFLMRSPDLRPPFHADNDACYLCNPTDLIAYFRDRHLAIVRRGRHGRPPLSYLFAGGTWVAARTPVQTTNRDGRPIGTGHG